MAVSYLSAGCGSLRRCPGEVVLASDNVVLPAEWWCDYILVDCTINGHGPFRMMLDTGAECTCVTPELAAQLRGYTFPHLSPATDGNGRRMLLSKAFRIEELQAGQARFRKFDALVIDFTACSDALGTKIDGLIGYPAFQDLLLTLDYPEQQASVRRGTLNGAAQANRFNSPHVWDRRPYAAMTIDDKPYRLLLDSASGSCIDVPEELFSTLAFHEEAVPVAFVASTGTQTRVTHGARLAANARVGSYIFEAPIIRTTGGSASAGVGLVRHFRITFDRDGGFVQFEREEGDPITTGPRLGLGVSFRRRGDEWTVWRVQPAVEDEQLDIRAGDRVRKINGVPVGQFGCRLSDTVDMAEEITLEVERGGRVWQVVLPVRVLVP